ncbi:hypothetical protein ARMSODRAFT_973818 [Armillaria solidipes]|uniref:Retrotransposon gag domain-containing protein n=1 Tax=Armillaria solidipes TaxID=1076256 RepID=A0A2H3BR20_9AGAR|nr:hypothetical protein ARMSODRAFT_973818 [Armillaria solidipes]
MLPDPPVAWDIATPHTNPWDKLKPKFFNHNTNAKLKFHTLKKLHQTNFKSGEVFFQKFEELALEADIIDNDQQMALMIKKAVRKTAKDSIYAQPNILSNTYEEWKHCILQIDYNYQLNRATGSAVGNTGNRTTGGSTQKGSSAGSGDKKTTTGTVYGGQGQAMDIDAMRADGRCYWSQEKGHISKTAHCSLGTRGRRRKRSEP